MDRFKSVNPVVRRRAGAILISLAALSVCAIFIFGCSQDRPVQLTTLSEQIPLTAPLELRRLETGHLIALVMEGDRQIPALYQSDSSGKSWTKWCDLPQLASLSGIEFSTAANLITVVAYKLNQLTISVATISSDTGTGLLSTPDFQTSEMTIPEKIQGIALAGSQTQTAENIHYQLAYLTGDPADSIRTIFHRWSWDRCQSWSNPIELDTGIIGSLDLDPAPAGNTSGFNLGYTLDYFYYWRSLSESDHTRSKRITLRIAPDSRNEIAKLGRNLFVTGDSHTNQVVGASSDNNGYNWSMAMSLAGHSDEPRRADVDADFNHFWVTYSGGDTLLAARTSTSPEHPRNWLPEIEIYRGAISGYPSIVALPDSTAGVLFATPDNHVHFAHIKKNAPLETP